MSPRQLHLLSLMATRVRGEVGQISAQIGALRHREMQQFDMADRLGRLLQETAQAPAQPMTRGELNAAQFMGRTLVQHLQDTRSQMAQTREERNALEADLSHHARRQTVLDARADETRRALHRAGAEAQDSTVAPRRRG
jgi:chromosome segregation ATPase